MTIMTSSYVESQSGSLVYVPEGHEGLPATVADVLERSAALLDEEGRWTRCTWLRATNMEHPDYREDPYCNGWSACADGALRLVTAGVIWSEHNDQWIVADEIADQDHLYRNAAKVILDVINELYGDEAPTVYDTVTGKYVKSTFPSIYRFNDGFATRTHVVNALTVAAAQVRV